MCLGVPGEVVQVSDTSTPPTAKVRVGGVVKEVLIATDESISPGDYVIVHAGVIISKINREEYYELVKLIESISGLGGELEL
ncbi:MAG: HypC/HybG/HupF family hydrogenase formation chaperone [Thermosphaera sp.]